MTKKLLAPILTIAGSLLFPPLAGALGLGGGGLLGLSGATVGSALGGAAGGAASGGGVKGALLGGLTSGLGSSLGGAINNVIKGGTGALSGSGGSSTLLGGAGADMLGGAGAGALSPAVSELVVNAVPGAIGGGSLGQALGAMGGSALGGALGGGATRVAPIEVVATGADATGAPQPGGAAASFPLSGGEGTDVLDNYEAQPGQVDSDRLDGTGTGGPSMTDQITSGVRQMPGNIAGGVLSNLIVGGLADALGLTGGSGGGQGGSYQPDVGGGSDGVPGNPPAGPAGPGTAPGGPSVGGGLVPMGGGGVPSPFSTGGAGVGAAPGIAGAVDIQGSSKPNIFPWVQPEKRAAF